MKKKDVTKIRRQKENYYLIGSLFGKPLGIICENEDDRNFISSAFHKYFRGCEYVDIKTERNPFLVAMKLYIELEEEKNNKKWYNRLFN